MLFTLAPIQLDLTTPPQCGWGHHITMTETQHNNGDGIPAAEPMVNIYISSMPGFKNGRFDSCEGVALKTNVIS